MWSNLFVQGQGVLSSLLSAHVSVGDARHDSFISVSGLR